MLKRKNMMCLCAALSVLLSLVGFSEAAKKPEEQFQELIKHRSVTLWVDGTKIEELVVGARARLNFTWLDDKLATLLNDNHMDFSQEADWHLASRAQARKAGQELIVVNCLAMQHFFFDPSVIQVNGETVKPGDVYTNLLMSNAGEMRPDDRASFAFGIPQKLLKPGTTIRFSTDQWFVDWVVPGK